MKLGKMFLLVTVIATLVLVGCDGKNLSGEAAKALNEQYASGTACYQHGALCYPNSCPAGKVKVGYSCTTQDAGAQKEMLVEATGRAVMYGNLVCCVDVNIPPEHQAGDTYCGDGIVQRPNDNGSNEDCDDKSQYCINCKAYGTPQGWRGCRGSGVKVCQEKLQNPDAYFATNPQCIRQVNCGIYGACNENYCPPETIPNCTDSDGGREIFVYGETTSTDGTSFEDVCVVTDCLNCDNIVVDSCLGNGLDPQGASCRLLEGECSATGSATHAKLFCPNGCRNGVCIPKQICNDSDGGVMFYTAGTVASQPPYDTSYNYISDFCEDDKTINEMYCTDEGTIPGQPITTRVGSKQYLCPYGCVDGACVNTVTEKYNLGSTGNPFNYGKDFYDMTPSLSFIELPSMLSNSTYKEYQGNTFNIVDYTQEIGFSDGAGRLHYYQDNAYAGSAAPYLLFPAMTPIYTYTLTFNSNLNYDPASAITIADDFKGSALNMQNKEFIIADAYGSTLSKLVFLGGQESFWIQSGVPVTKMLDGTSYEITLVGVNSAEDQCTITVNGVTQTLNVYAQRNFAGLNIGLVDANVIQNSEQYTHLCKIIFNSEELVLENGKRVKRNGNYVDGSLAILTSAAGKLYKIEIFYEPINNPIYLGQSQIWADPVFGKFKIRYAGDVRDDESLSLTAASRAATFKYVNPDGKEVNLPFYRKSETDGRVWLGKSDTEEVHLEGSTCINSEDGCTNEYFLVVSNNNVHLMKITSIDISNGQINIYDETYDKEYFSSFKGGGRNSIINLGEVGNINLTIINTTTLKSVKFNDIDDGKGMRTSGNNAIILMQGADNYGANPYNLQIKENPNSNRRSILNITFNYDQIYDRRIEIAQPKAINNGAYGGNSGWLNASSTNYTTKVLATNYGSVFKYNDQDKNFVYMVMPKNVPTHADVFVS